MATIVTRSGKGSPLTNAEVDANFTNLNDDKAELSGANFTGSIDVTGTVTADGLTVDGSYAQNKAAGTFFTLTDTTNSKTGYINWENGDWNIFTNGPKKRWTIADNGDISFYEDTGTTPKFFWDASTERLGLGTTSPAYALHVDKTLTDAYSPTSEPTAAASIYNAGNLSATNTHSALRLEVRSSSGIFQPVFLSAVQNAGTYTPDFTISTRTGASTYAERMRITSAGNVGIGTTSPVTGIDFGISQGNVSQIINTYTNANYRAGIGMDSATAGVRIYAPSTDPIAIFGQISTADGSTFTEKVRIDSAGNVGIGTSSPGEKLVVANAGGSVAIQALANATGTSNLYFAKGTSGADSYNGFIQYNHSTDTMNFGTNGGNTRATIDSSGNVGIGTSSPSGRLDVKAPTGNSNIAITTGTTTADSIRLNAGGSVTNWLEYRGYLGHVWFDNVGERMRIDASGNLLVGKSATGTNTAGTEIYGGSNAGILALTCAGRPLYINRLSTDGDLIEFEKDGTTVGSIGSVSSLVTGIVLDPRTNGSGIRGSTNAIYPIDENRANSDGGLDLGAPTVRWKDLYLSNGVQLSNGGAVFSTSSAAKISMYGGATNRGGQIDFHGGINSNGILVFRTGAGVGEQSERARIDDSGNLLLGGTGKPTSSAGNFVLYNGTAPTGNATDGVILYAEDVSSSSELKVRDEAGNVTTLSPHNFDLIPEGPSEDMAWSYYSERDGKRINVDMLKAIRVLEQLSGEKLVHIV